MPNLDLMAELLPSLLSIIDLIAAAVFATTGALVASRKQMDIVGFLWLGVVTGVGGGTLRDLILGVPVFWVENTMPVIVCLIISAIVYFAAHLIQNRYRLILWLDAAGLALFAVAGADKALDVNADPLVAVVMGVISATAGGVIRDILGQEPSIILRREIYVTAAALGAVIFVLLSTLGQPPIAATLIAFFVAFAIRGLAIAFGWSLPIYRARPGRDVHAREHDKP
ncbi:MAG: trimeric intracellular cation channel family protein [Hyphomicrobiaceae bacterium]